MADYTQATIDDKSKDYFTSLIFAFYTKKLKNIYDTMCKSILSGEHNIQTPQKINIPTTEMKNIRFCF
jgi:hypothetical protein